MSAAVLRLGLMVATFIAVADQIIKPWAIDALTDRMYAVEVTPFLNLVMVWNRGISFGMFGGGAVPPWLLAGLALAVALVLVVWLSRVESRLLAVALGLVIGGAVGNAIDRFRYGAVADFVDVYWGDFHWPAFNLADSSIFVGVVILLIDALLIGDERHK